MTSKAFSPRKGLYAPAWAGKTPRGAQLRSFIASAELPYKYPLPSAKTTAKSSSRPSKSPKPVNMHGNRADGILRDGERNVVKKPRSERDRVSRLMTVRKAANLMEDSRLHEWKNSHSKGGRGRRRHRSSPPSTGRPNENRSQQDRAVAAAVKLQAVFRGHREREGPAAKAVTVAQRVLHHRRASAANLQRVFRGHRERAQGESTTKRALRTKQRHGALKMQATYRGHQGRREGAARREVRRRDAGALRLQAAHRGHLERTTGESVTRSAARQELRHTQQRLAPKLQKVYRGHRGRLKAHATRALLERITSLSSVAMKVFATWDSDRSGTIDKEEFRYGVRSLGLTEAEGFTEADVDDVFASFDTDQSASITINELTAALNIAKRRARVNMPKVG